MTIGTRPIVIAVLMILFAGCAHQTFAQARVAGVILEIRGRAEWRHNASVKKPKQLHPTLDRGRALHVREQVRAVRKGTLVLFLCSGYKELYPAEGWLTLSAADECPNRTMLDSYGKIGGGSRSGSTPIFFPADHSAITPGLFKIQWIPSLAKCILKLSIKEMDGRTLWDEENIDGNMGSWDSPKARQELMDYRTKGEESPLVLQLTDSCANQTKITFSLISANSEASLQAELVSWRQKRPVLLRHLGRAYVFERYRLFSNAAEEYEVALSMAPESRHLLVRTIIAHRVTGNFAREEELKKRMPPGINVPKRIPRN